MSKRVKKVKAWAVLCKFKWDKAPYLAATIGDDISLGIYLDKQGAQTARRVYGERGNNTRAMIIIPCTISFSPPLPKRTKAV